MSTEKVETLIIGAGQAGLAMSEHLSRHNEKHLILERGRIVERWRSERWDSLVANGPAWHDRFPTKSFTDSDPNSFVQKDKIVDYFVEFANEINAPVRSGVEVTELVQAPDGNGFLATTSAGVIEARNVVVATGPFQKAVIPPVVPDSAGLQQIHSCNYKNPQELPEGAVLVIGAGSSGAQIADELARSGRKVYLSVGPHERPPIRYRGKDFCWWLGVLGLWDAKAREPGLEHVTIAVSGAHGGKTVDFRRFAARGMTLVGRAETYQNGVLTFAPDLARNLAMGDKSYHSLLDAADAYVEKEDLDLPEEPEARMSEPDPDCLTNPLLSLNLHEANVTSIIWATGYERDFSWIKFDTFDEKGNPVHEKGASKVPGLYFLGLAWLSRRASPFIWGVWHDASHLADVISAKNKSSVPAE